MRQNARWKVWERLLFIIAALITAVQAAPHPEKLASHARLDLTASEEVREIRSGALLDGNGSLDRPGWLSEGERSRWYTVSFPVQRFQTNSLRLVFEPVASGSVMISLKGPWEEAPEGPIYRQEILWESLEISGAEWEDGAWARLSKPALAWHDRPLNLRIKVEALRRVTLSARARPAVPSSAPDMARIASRDTPAHRAAQKFRRGVNLGNYLEAPPDQNWGATYSEKDFHFIRQEGFDHVRLPVAWHHYAGPAPGYALRPEIFGQVDFLVTNALNQGLSVILNLHHFDAFTSDPETNHSKFVSLWRQIAAHYQPAPGALAFELLNEPKDAATTARMNEVYARTLKAIRASNPDRTVFLGPGRWNQASELASLLLPDDDLNLIVTVHCYDPFYFTHQGATWAGPDVKPLAGIEYPGPPRLSLRPDSSWNLRAHVLDWIKKYNTQPTTTNPSSRRAFEGPLKLAKAWSEYYGRPVHVGEFGCYERADSVSRARFYKEFRETLDELELGWALWDWKAGFRYWDPEREGPVPGMREALFPKRP